MLPYRLRPPAYGTKQLKEQQQQQQQQDPTTKSLPLEGGGPVQQAIQQDLRQLAVQFQQQLECVASQLQQQLPPQPQPQQVPQQQSQQHWKPGTAFDVFRTVFANAKVALWHTRFVPPRCDRGQFSQLLYAACFSLMVQQQQQAAAATATAIVTQPTEKDNENHEDNEQQDNHPGRRHHDAAAFALFCLYALYETNPLPPGPTTSQNQSTNDNDDNGTQGQHDTNHNNHDNYHPTTTKKELLDMLPMGLHVAESARIVYRRAFRRPIRIDRFHYALLLQLREDAWACQAKCQQSRLVAMTARLQQQPHPHHQQWSCGCGVATDTIHIVERLFPKLDLCEYTGPGSVEGLAGHEEYPFPCVPPPITRQQQQQQRRQRQTLVGPVPSNNHNDVATVNNVHQIVDKLLRDARNNSQLQNPSSLSSLAIPESMTFSIQEYQSSLRSIQIPSHLSAQKTLRFKQSLAPILQSTTTGLPSWEQLTRQLVAAIQLAVESSSSSTTTTTTGEKSQNQPPPATTRETAPVTRRQLRSRRRRVTWAAGLDPDTNNNNNNNARKKGVAQGKRGARQQQESHATHRNTEVVAQDMSYELVLPNNLPMTLQEGIQKALEHILDRDQPIFLPNDTGSKAELDPAAAAKSNISEIGDETLDDVSSIGIGGVSMAQSSRASVSTNKGGAALKALLAQAHGDENSVTYNPPDDSLETTRKNNPLPSMFLTMDDDGTADEMGRNGADDDEGSETSNLSTSDLDEDDAVSVATSAVGQGALATLLLAVSNSGKAQGKLATKKSRTSSTTKTKSTTAKTKSAQRKTSSNTPKTRQTKQRNPKSNKPNARQAKQGNMYLANQKEDVSVASTVDGGRAGGRAALGALLALAEEASQSQSSDLERSESPATSDSGEDLLADSKQQSKSSSANLYDDESVASSHTGEGRATIHQLLSLATKTTTRRSTVGRVRRSHTVNAAHCNTSTIHAECTNSQKRKRGEGRGRGKRRRTRSDENEDDSSAFTSLSGQGNAALAALLRETDV